MNALRTLIAILGLAAASALGACSSAHTASNASSSDSPRSAAPSGSDLGAPSSDPYPDRVAAVAPEYPTRVDEQAITPRLYQIDSPDTIATVLAWYKAHTTGGTWKSSDPDAPQEYFYVAQDGVKIDIQYNHYPGTDTSGKTVKTMIAITQPSQ